MGIREDERLIYNAAVKETNLANKKILAAYEKSLQNIQTQIIDVNLKALRGDIVTKTAVSRTFRLQELYKQINTEASKLKASIGKIIISGYDKNYRNTYYTEAYAFEKEINTGLKLGADYSLNYPVLNPDVVAASFNPTIGDRITGVTNKFKIQLKQFVAETVIEGKTVKELAEELNKINELLEPWEAERISRTELLRAYSEGQAAAAEEAEKSGVEFVYIWKATLDSKTRKDHVEEDNKKAEIVEGIDGRSRPIFDLSGVKLNSPRVVDRANSKDPRAQVINCRCRRINAPFGIKPTKRVAKMPDGTWVEIEENIDAEAWIEENYPEEQTE